MKIAHHLADDARLLRVLAPEKRFLRLNDFEQLQYNGRDAAKMPLPHSTFEALREAFDIYPGAKSRRINFRGLRRKQIINARAFQFFAVRFERARIFLEILAGTELSGIHEDGSDHRLRLGESRANERQMPCVERAHGWHEAGGAPFGARLTRHLLHPFDGVDGFQEGVVADASACGGFCRAIQTPQAEACAT